MALVNEKLADGEKLSKNAEEVFDDLSNKLANEIENAKLDGLEDLSDYTTLDAANLLKTIIVEHEEKEIFTELMEKKMVLFKSHK